MDTTAIIGAHDFGVWKILRARFRLETVEKCVEEAASGNPNRPAHVAVDTAAMRRDMMIHPVVPADLIKPSIDSPSFAGLDEGEKQLLAHAMTRGDCWTLTSQDKKCLKAGHELGVLDRMVSLQELAERAGTRVPMHDPYTKRWLGRIKTDIHTGVL